MKYRINENTLKSIISESINEVLREGQYLDRMRDGIKSTVNDIKQFFSMNERGIKKILRDCGWGYTWEGSVNGGWYVEMPVYASMTSDMSFKQVLQTLNNYFQQNNIPGRALPGNELQRLGSYRYDLRIEKTNH